MDISPTNHLKFKVTFNCYIFFPRSESPSLPPAPHLPLSMLASLTFEILENWQIAQLKVGDERM